MQASFTRASGAHKGCDARNVCGRVVVIACDYIECAISNEIVMVVLIVMISPIASFHLHLNG